MTLRPKLNNNIDQFLQCNKLQGDNLQINKTTFAFISHYINNPLTIIALNAEKNRNTLESIQIAEQVERITLILDQLKTYIKD